MSSQARFDHSAITPEPIDDVSLDRYARMVRRSLKVPTALVTFIEADRQIFPGAAGLPEPFQTDRQTPLSHSFCQYVVADQRPLIVADARDEPFADPRLRGNLAIEELGVVAYAGWPLTDSRGRVVGSLCAVDSEPREWTADELDALEDLAAACSAEIAQRDQMRQAAISALVATDLSHRSAVLLALSEGLSTTQTLVDVAQAVGAISLEHLGCLQAGLWLRETTRPSTASDLPRFEGGVESMRYIEEPGLSWPGAQKFSALPLEHGNPLADVLLRSQPVFYRCREDQDVLYPQLVNPDQVGEARAFMPLSVQGHGYGTLVLVWEDAREFTDEDRVTIAALTSYAAQAVHRSLLLQDRTDALVTLQAAMLTELPSPDELQFAARYRPAASRDQVGGDWYDAVTMPSGATCLMIGDVVGHDIAAAAVMGQLRNMLRALAWALDDQPSVSVTKLDQAVADLDVRALATLVFARIEQTDEQRAAGVRMVRWTNAGHPAPLLIEPDGTCRFLDEGLPNPMLGVLPDSVRTDQTVEVVPGSILLLYTDGLVERRGESIGIGFERLAASAGAHWDRPLSAMLDAVLADLVEARPKDDVAVLAVCFLPQD